MMGWAGELTWTGWIVMAVCMLAFWAVVIYLMAMMFRTDRANGPGRTSQESDPLRLLETRFARGDIDSDEFVARRQVLMHPGDTTKVEHRQGHVHG